MSTEVLKDAHHGHDDHGHGDVYHQFVDIEQQNDAYIVGMWAFLVTEIMFFGGMFLCYTLYRWQYQPHFYLVHKELSVLFGGINTVILLLSSFTMACAVHFAQLKDRKKQQMMLMATNVFAAGFLFVKIVFEWIPKYQHGHMPWAWEWPGHVSDAALLAVPGGAAKMFYSLYFAMTGLHGIHVLIGIICISILMWLTHKKSHLVESFLPTEMVGLYWHFVDLVWIFLFPLFYLMPA